MAPPLSHLRLLTPPLRLLLGAMWRVAKQPTHQHYGMLEELVAVATEAVPELLSIKEKTALLLALRTKRFLADPDPGLLDPRQVSSVTDSEWEDSMSCLKAASVSTNLPPQTLNEVFGGEFDAALESLLHHFLSRLEQRLPVPDFTSVSVLLTDDWLTDCLQEVKSQELKELLTNHSTAHTPQSPDLVSKPELVLKSAWQQLQRLQKLQEPGPTNHKQDQPGLTNHKQDHPGPTNETQEQPRVTNQRPAVPPAANQRPAVAPAASQIALLKLAGNKTVLSLVPANQSTESIVLTNQQVQGIKRTNQSTAAVVPANQSAASQRISSKNVSVVETTNQEPVLHQEQDSDQLEPSSPAVMAPPPDAITQRSRRVAHKCPVCKKGFIYRNQVLKHMSSSRSCKSVSQPAQCCFQCPEFPEFQSQSALQSHFRTHRVPPVPFLTQSRPEPEPETRPGPPRAPKEPAKKSRSFPCSLCEEIFSGQKQLLSHLDQHQLRGDTPTYECLHCDQSFSDSTALRVHQRSHTPRPFTCEVCGKGFQSSRCLGRHMRHHGEKTFLCQVCGKSFVLAKSLESHSRLHSDHAPFTCSVCGRGFRFPTVLRIHMRRHLGVKPYSCSECGKKFRAQGDLGPHMRTHTGEKPYSCTQCGKKFTFASHLRIHQQIHSGEKPHSCSECGRTFLRKQMLENHMRRHRNERPFSCQICLKAYTCRSHLNRHLRTHQNQL